MTYIYNIRVYVYPLTSFIININLLFEGYRPGKKCCDNYDPDSQTNPYSDRNDPSLENRTKKNTKNMELSRTCI